MQLHFPPQNFIDFGAVFAVMFLIMWVFYFLRLWIHSTQYSEKLHRLGNTMEVFQNKIANFGYRVIRLVSEEVNNPKGSLFRLRK